MIDSPRLALGLLAALLLGLPTAARAAVIYDLRLNDNNPDGSTITYPGEVIMLDLFARVTGNSAGVEGFQEGYGSVIATTTGGVTGGLSATLAAPFAMPGS